MHSSLKNDDRMNQNRVIIEQNCKTQNTVTKKSAQKEEAIEESQRRRKIPYLTTSHNKGSSSTHPESRVDDF